jgi:hypothetical protein
VRDPRQRGGRGTLTEGKEEGAGSLDHGEAMLGGTITGGKEDRPIGRSPCEGGDVELCSKERKVEQGHVRGESSGGELLVAERRR